MIKVEEREVLLNTREGTRVLLRFANIEAVVCVHRPYDCEKIAIAVEMKSSADIKLGVSLHLKSKAVPFDPYTWSGGDEKDQYYSASASLIAFSKITCERTLLELQAPKCSYDLYDDDYPDLSARVKVFWEAHALFYPTVVDKKAIVRIDGEELEVDCRILSACSEYFSGYFSSALIEGQEGKYPISDCSMFAFAELLAVIHPCGKPIDNQNVAMLLELARRYMIPTLTHKCESFLVERMNRKEAVIENLDLSDKFGLDFTSEVLLSTFGDGSKFREVLRDPKFDELSDSMKYRIKMKYIEVDMLNNPEDRSDMME